MNNKYCISKLKKRVQDLKVRCAHCSAPQSESRCTLEGIHWYLNNVLQTVLKYAEFNILLCTSNMYTKSCWPFTLDVKSSFHAIGRVYNATRVWCNIVVAHN